MVKRESEIIEDSGSKLILRDESGAALLRLIERAKSKGWSSVEIVEGSHEAKRTLWFQASMAGLEVRGYAPTLSDRAKLQRLQQDHRGSPLECTVIRADRVLRDYDERVLPELRKELIHLSKEREKKGIRTTVLDIAYGLNRPQNFTERSLDDRYHYLRQKLSEATRSKELFLKLGSRPVRLRTSYEDGLPRYILEEPQQLKQALEEQEISRASITRRKPG